MDNSMEGSLSSDIGDTFGDPEVLPRVGDQFQVEIPLPMMDYDCLQLIRKPKDTEVAIDVPNYFTMGLSIPIMWVHDEVENIKEKSLEVHGNQDDAVNVNGPVESENSEESQITSNNKDAELKNEHLGTALDKGEEVRGYSNHQPMVEGHKTDAKLVLSQAKATKFHGDNGYRPVPGSLGDAWSDIEHDSFLLGIYIFGKNLRSVKKFVESKEMGDILSYYYGKFYRSGEYIRWAECRKIRSRQHIDEHKIFTGWRQQEVLVRLFSHVSEECKNMLMEVSRRFGERKLSLEEYVFTVKKMVGINMLVEAVAIGKVKQDLTDTTMEPKKTKQFFPVRPEIPIGRACSSLTPEEIIQLLTGDFRLSKARSNDIFWEAIWPRLLERGWHAEQPRDRGYAGLKHSLVFLKPGVKKFSRRRLVKGNHFFDCVTDVLNRVASDPGLLELEFEAANVSTQKKEYSSDPHMKQGPPVFSGKQHHSYLQPRNSNCNGTTVKFSIVDTSLVYGEEGVKVRELRSLPADPINVPTPSEPIHVFTLSGLSSETEQDTTEESQDKAEENNASNLEEDVTESGAFAELTECGISTVNNHLPNGPDPMIAAVGNHEDQSTSVSNDRQSRMMMKFQFSRKVKSHKSNDLAPITKQFQPTACSHGESSHRVENISIDTKLNGEGSRCWSNSPDTCKNRAFQVGTSQNLLSVDSLIGSPEEKTHPQTLIDLNLPYVPLDSVIDELVHTNDDASAKKSSLLSETSQQPEELNPSNAGPGAELQPVVNDRRQSTRNRPMSTRALEAVACGFLIPKRKRKVKVEAMSQESSNSRSSRRVRGKTADSTTRNDGVDDDVA